MIDLMPGDQPPESLLQSLQQPYPPPPPPHPQNLPRETIDARNSLGDLLRIYPLALDDTPEAIALPESPTASSTASHELHVEGLVNKHGEGSDASRPSLEVLSQSRAPVVPSTIPLPESRPLSRDQRHEETLVVLERAIAIARGSRQPTQYAYKYILDNAGRVLDHIKKGNVVKQSRHNRTSITYYDHINDVRCYPRQIHDAKSIARLGHAPPNVQQRLVIVEDLSKPTIDALGETFSINPEFFEGSSTASMAETLTYGAASGHVGGVAMALRWIAVGLIAFVSLGLFVTNLSIALLKKASAPDTVDGSSAEIASMLSDSVVGV